MADDPADTGHAPYGSSRGIPGTRPRGLALEGLESYNQPAHTKHG